MYSSILPYLEQIIIGFLDPSASASPDNPGWPRRNLLAYLLALHLPHTVSLRVLCWRDGDLPTPGRSWKSRFGVVSHPGSGDPTAKPTALGWERHPTTNKLSARMADLAPMMDPTRYYRSDPCLRSLTRFVTDSRTRLSIST
jgi:ubiquitin-like modifier-activating enzyme ATG7